MGEGGEVKRAKERIGIVCGRARRGLGGGVFLDRRNGDLWQLKLFWGDWRGECSPDEKVQIPLLNSDEAWIKAG